MAGDLIGENLDVSSRSERHDAKTITSQRFDHTQCVAADRTGGTENGNTTGRHSFLNILRRFSRRRTVSLHQVDGLTVASIRRAGHSPRAIAAVLQINARGGVALFP